MITGLTCGGCVIVCLTPEEGQTLSLGGGWCKSTAELMTGGNMLDHKIRTTLAGGVLIVAVALGTVGTGTPAMAATPSVPAAAQTAVTAQTTLSATTIRSARDLGPCWAQAGRVVGGLYGSLIASASNPWAAAAAWAAYLGSLSQEKRDKAGNFAC